MATILTSTGATLLADIIGGTIVTYPAFIGSGTATACTCAGTTGIGTETCDVRSTGTFSKPAADTLRNVGTITYGATKTVGNAGELVTTSTGNVCGLVVHGNFTGIAVNSGDKIQFTIDLQIT